MPDFSSEMVIENVKRFWPWVLIPAGLYVIPNLLSALVPGPHRKPKLNFKDKTVLITGASTGLGRALAFELYARGAKLILTARSIDKLKELCEELKGSKIKNRHEPVYRYLDICEPSDLEKLVDLSLDGKTIDVLVNNAGLSNRGPVSETPMSVHRQVMEVNYFGHIEVTRALLPYIPDTGCIIVTSSVQGRIAVPYRSAYSASKHAIQGFFDALRCEERHDLQILMVSAGYMNTGFGSKALDTSGKPVQKEDADQAKGYTAEYSAQRVVDAAENREIELILAPFSNRIGIFLRWLWPSLFYFFMYKRGLKDEYGKKK
ncbi:unnamed protein product, partial [Mesorhabditis belari]|uniref:Ketoreductase domain-containing protein n=1 Tax=Mesorhabditis belari TaxID=2138241 RepID=A0AAF3FJH8_9BILA